MYSSLANLIRPGLDLVKIFLKSSFFEKVKFIFKIYLDLNKRIQNIWNLNVFR